MNQEVSYQAGGTVIQAAVLVVTSPAVTQIPHWAFRLNGIDLFVTLLPHYYQQTVLLPADHSFAVCVTPNPQTPKIWWLVSTNDSTLSAEFYFIHQFYFTRRTSTLHVELLFCKSIGYYKICKISKTDVCRAKRTKLWTPNVYIVTVYLVRLTVN